MPVVDTDQEDPSQRSARNGVVPTPTAMQKLGPTHDTELSSAPFVADAGLLVTVHAAPFHCSMRAPRPEPAFCAPTATQKLALVQEIDFSSFEPEPAAAFVFVQLSALTGGGVVWPPAPTAGASSATPPANTNPAAINEAFSDPTAPPVAPLT
jgi:hypothetical protein